MRTILSRSMRLARATAPPDMTMLREAKVPKPKAVLSVSPCRTEISARVDAEFLGGDLRQRRLQTLAVRLDADHQHDAAVGQDARGAALETGDDRGAARGEFGGAVRGLLGKAGKADADQPAVRLAPLLPRADRRQVQQLGARRTLAG